MLLEILRAMCSSVLGTMGFAILIHAPQRAALPASVVGGVTYLAFWLMTTLGVS